MNQNLEHCISFDGKTIANEMIFERLKLTSQNWKEAKLTQTNVSTIIQ